MGSVDIAADIEARVLAVACSQKIVSTTPTPALVQAAFATWCNAPPNAAVFASAAE